MRFVSSCLIQEQLLNASELLQSLGLSFSSKWAAEQVIGLDSKLVPSDSSASDGPQAAAMVVAAEDAPQMALQLQHDEGLVLPSWHASERAQVRLAQSLYQLRELQRVASVLQPCTSSMAKFIRRYALYLHGEKKLEESKRESPANDVSIINPNLEALREEFEVELDHERTGKSGPIDGVNLYLYGLVLLNLQSADKAREVLVSACRRYPWNWAAWEALSRSCTKYEHLLRLLDHRLVQEISQASFNYMLEFFRASCEIELQLTPQGKERFQRLHATFPSPYVQGQTAFALFHLRQYDEASRLYEELRQSYPFRLEGLDNYSNILYVTEERAMLSVLAQYAVEVDKYRPETCFIVGNYYSIKADHTRAIMYFQRALRLEPKYSGSWTLIGHEYLEMRAGESAINAYRNAIAINPKDSRPWYGMGQAYELLQMPAYALYYFRRAATIQPYEPRMWLALGDCYEYMRNLDEALICFQRAIEVGDTSPGTLDKVKRLSEFLGSFARK